MGLWVKIRFKRNEWQPTAANLSHIVNLDPSVKVWKPEALLEGVLWREFESHRGSYF